MDYFQALIIGIIEGFTEFLPISSTGHMIVASTFLGLPQDNLTKAYEVIIQLAAILAVVIIYRDKIHLSKILLWEKVLVAFLPLMVVGYLLKDVIKTLFTVEIVGGMFILGGVVFLVLEYFYTEQEYHLKDVEKISYRQALWIGIAQILSLIPGTSRSGATIVGGLLVHLDRKASAEFSFLLAIPVMLAVSGYDLLQHYEEFSRANWGVFIVGFLVAFVVAYLTIKLFFVFIQRFTFVLFGLYRILFGMILLVIF